MKSSRRVAVVCVAVALLAGCADEPLPPTGNGVEQARERARKQTASAVVMYETLGTPLARGSSDGCAVGQRNGKVDDGFDVLCAQATAAVIGVDNVDARQAAQLALTPPAGCLARPSGRDDPAIREQTIAGFIAADPSAEIVGLHTCDGVEIRAVAVRSTDEDLKAGILRMPYSLATTIERRPLSASFDRIDAAQYEFLIVINARAEYVRR